MASMESSSIESIFGQKLIEKRNTESKSVFLTKESCMMSVLKKLKSSTQLILFIGIGFTILLSSSLYNSKASNDKIWKYGNAESTAGKEIKTREDIKLRKYLEKRYHPWPNIPSCKNFSTSFAPPHSQKLVALASYPGSGNTWFRYLLEGSTGLFTGSVFDDLELYESGMYGEKAPYDSGMTIAVKVHAYLGKKTGVKLKDDKIFEKGVVIIRNPFECLISLRNLYQRHSHTGHAQISDFMGKGWKKFVLFEILAWKNFNEKWLTLTNAEDIYIILYEELKLEPLKITEAVLEFLHVPVNSQRMDCISKHLEGKFKREHRNMTNPFTIDLKIKVYEAIDLVNDILLQKTNKTLPLQHYKFYNETEAAMARKNE